MGFLAIHAYLLYITRKICESLQKIFHGVLIEKDKEKNKKIGMEFLNILE